MPRASERSASSLAVSFRPRVGLSKKLGCSILKLSSKVSIEYMRSKPSKRMCLPAQVICGFRHPFVVHARILQRERLKRIT